MKTFSIYIFVTVKSSSLDPDNIDYQNETDTEDQIYYIYKKIHLLDPNYTKTWPRVSYSKLEAIKLLYNFLNVKTEKEAKECIIFGKGNQDHKSLKNLWKRGLDLEVKDCNSFENLKCVKKLFNSYTPCHYHKGKVVKNKNGVEDAHCSLNDTVNLAEHFLQILK